MTTFLERTGRDLATASVVAPLASYGLHRMIPTPDVRFIAVASTLNLYVMVALRGLTYQHLEARVKHKSASNTDFVLERLGSIFEISAIYLLPIFTKSICQRVGILVPDYLPLMGYISLASGAFWIAKSCIEICEAYYNPATK